MLHIFKYKMGPIIPSLVNFTRVLGGMRGSVCVKTIPETEVHPRSCDTYLLNELPCWLIKHMTISQLGNSLTASAVPIQQRSVLWKIIFPENWGIEWGGWWWWFWGDSHKECTTYRSLACTAHSRVRVPMRIQCRF